MAKQKKHAVNWFVERTSMHGVPSLAKSKSTKSKVFWGCVYLIGMGMFVLMFISLIIKYFSYPTAVRIDQVSKGIVLPKISFCNKRYASLLTEIAFAKTMKDYVTEQKSPYSHRITSAVKNLHTLLYKLGSLRGILSDYAVDNKTINETSKDGKEKLTIWSTIADKLVERWLLSSLIYRHKQSEEDLWNSLSGLNIHDTMVFCGNGKVNWNWDYFSNFRSINTLLCFTYDQREGQAIKESNVQGILNGVTFVFMTGGKLLGSEYGNFPEGFWKFLPGYENTFHPSIGSDGIQLMIHDPDTAPYPELDGIAVAPGMATTIGLTSKENIRLSKPYGECSSENIEGNMMMNSVRERLGHSPVEGSGILDSAYRVGRCRETCLLRHIWEHCGCLFFSEGLPFINSSLLCGRIDPIVLLNTTNSEIQKCFEEKYIANDECIRFLDPLLTDIKCVHEVFQMESYKDDKEHDRDFQCHCPPPCHARDYDMIMGISKWPSPRPETDSSYYSIVQEVVIPYFSQFNTSLTTDVIKYLNDSNNKPKIMNNFARVTVYIRSLKVDRVEQIASYSAVDLISDIGGQLGLWVGISAITLCEIFGFLSLAIQNVCARIHGKRDNNENEIPSDETTQKML